MTKYVPRIRALADGKYEQTFDANHAAVEIEDGAVMLAAADGEYGAIHGLVMSSPELEPFRAEDVYVEFNDQGNGCSGSDVAVSFDGNQLLIEYADNVQVWVGRISYQPDADPLREPDDESELPLRRLVINLKSARRRGRRFATSFTASSATVCRLICFS
jgi:hypothetical protein